MTADTLPSRDTETTLYMHWNSDNYAKQVALDSALARLSPAALADEEIRAELTRRADEITLDRAVWLACARHGFERDVGRAIAHETRRGLTDEYHPR